MGPEDKKKSTVPRAVDDPSAVPSKLNNKLIFMITPICWTRRSRSSRRNYQSPLAPPSDQRKHRRIDGLSEGAFHETRHDNVGTRVAVFTTECSTANHTPKTYVHVQGLGR